MPAENPVERLMSEHPDLQLLRTVADEVEARFAVQQRLPLLRYRDPALQTRHLVAPGAAVLFVARPGSQQLLDIRRGVRESDHGLLGQVAERVYGSLVDRQPVSLDEAVRLFVDGGSSVDLTYFGSPLVSNAFLPEDLEIAAFPMPYTGGPLEEKHFTLTARARADAQTWFDAILVINEPDLSEMERAALDLVPPDELVMQVGKAAMCYAITAVTVFIVVAVATYACPGIGDLEHLDDDVVRSLRPSATARELLALRRQGLERRGG